MQQGGARVLAAIRGRDDHFVVARHVEGVRPPALRVFVVVDGRILMKERDILTIDTDRVAREANALAARIKAALDERNQPN